MGTESSKTGAVSVNAYKRAKWPKFHTFHNIFIFLWARQCECIKKIYQEGISKRNNVCLYNPRNTWEPINLKLSFYIPPKKLFFYSAEEFVTLHEFPIHTSIISSSLPPNGFISNATIYKSQYCTYCHRKCLLLLCPFQSIWNYKIASIYKSAVLISYYTVE